MKLSKNIYLVVTILLLVCILAGCSLIPSTTQPKGSISGQVLFPPNAEKISKDITGWIPLAGAEVKIVDASGVTHTVTTDENGYYSFEDIAVNPNTVVTATATIDGNNVILKSVISLEVTEDQDYDAGEMTPESTALALVVEGLIASGETQTDIDLEDITSNNNFSTLSEKVTTVLEAGGDVTVDDDIIDTVNDIVNPPTSPSPTPSTGSPSTPATQITGIDIDGNAVFTETLTATPEPAEATATYQWQRSNTEAGTYADIAGATSETYTLTVDDIQKWLQIVATGAGDYAGTVTSDSLGPITKAEGPAAPSAPTVFEVTDTHIQLQWRNDIENRMDEGNWTNWFDFYDLTPDTFYTIYARYIETETHLASGSSEGTVIKTKKSLGSIGAITGAVNVGQVLTAGPLTPAGATAAYQWQASDAEDGTYEDISGATSNTYTLTAAELGKWIKVTADGTDDYYGSVTSAAVGPVEVGVITLDGILGVTKPVTGVTPVTTMTETAQYTGTVSWSPAHNPFQGETVYTATISLTAKTGYTLTGVPADYFTVAGATSATNSADSGVVTAVFPKTVYKIGDKGPAGGVIFYINPNSATEGWKYLEVAPSYTEMTGKQWSGVYIDVPGTQEGIGTGEANTGLIVAALPGEINCAAQLCAALTVENNSVTYDDWFLPSKDELWLILGSSFLWGVGYADISFDYNYWTSSQITYQTAWFEGYTVFGHSGWGSAGRDKMEPYNVRAIRSF